MHVVTRKHLFNIYRNSEAFAPEFLKILKKCFIGTRSESWFNWSHYTLTRRVRVNNSFFSNIENQTNILLIFPSNSEAAQLEWYHQEKCSLYGRPRHDLAILHKLNMGVIKNVSKPLINSTILCSSCYSRGGVNKEKIISTSRVIVTITSRL